MRTIGISCCWLALAACGGSSGGSDDAPADPPPSAPPTGGLDARPSNTACVAPSLEPGAGSTVALERVFENLPAPSQPLGLMQAPGDAGRWFVLERTGRVRVFENDPDVAAYGNDFIDLPVSTDGEGGLLGMAFHPEFASNGRVFLSWTEGAAPLVSVIARFESRDGGQTLDAGTRADIVTVNQDFSNHNGGNIAFGPDGYLYIGLGDGGSGGDPISRAQDTRNLLGAMLRVDVDGDSPYAIPPDNPFAGNPVCPADHSSPTDCPEIFAWGLRNPWRWSFDRDTGELWVGDVGQGAREEIDIVERNGNYGWDCREGSVPYTGPPDGPASACPAPNVRDPVHEYPRSVGSSVTGGYVYRGSVLAELVGDYVFADYGSGRIFRLASDGAGGWVDEELLDTSLSIASFGQDNDGELYVVDIAGGGIHRLVDGGGGPAPSPVAALLSDTGCVDPSDPSRPASGLIPFDVAAPFWSDGADKERWIALPNGTTVTRDADGDFMFPDGTVLMKHFRLEGALVETRLFMRHPGGDWAGYSYAWDAAGTDGTLVQGGRVEPIGGQDWIYPSGNDCLTCHTSAAGFALGLEDAELNHDFTYPSTGRTANQLFTLDDVGVFASPLGDPAALPALVDPFDTSADLGERARAYLHTNCAQCHRPAGPTPSAMDLRFSTLLDNTNTCDIVPQSGNLGLGTAARIVAPGEPDLSVLLARMERRDVDGMPPLATSRIDTAGAALIREWIGSLTTCL